MTMYIVQLVIFVLCLARIEAVETLIKNLLYHLTGHEMFSFVKKKFFLARVYWPLINVA
jgi:hypothetical protein